jgi:hypothetical protein
MRVLLTSIRSNRIKTKCPGWKRINAERHKLFEGPRKPE